MKFMKGHRGVVLRLIDLSIWMVGAVAAMFLANAVMPNPVTILIAIAVVHVAVYQFFAMYQTIWRYAGIRQLMKCLVCEAASYFLVDTIAILVFSVRMNRFSIAAFLFTAVLMVSSRLIYAAAISKLHDGVHLAEEEKKGIRTLIIGAGEAADILLCDMKRDRRHTYNPIGLVDDDPGKQGRRLWETKVYGPIADLKKFADELKAQLIVFAIFDISEEQKRAIMELCASTGVKVMMAPSPKELHEVGEGISQRLREVDVNDLLGREPMLLDDSLTKSELQGRRVLVTGGGGSIGSELCRQIAAMDPAELVMLDVYENGVYDVQQELRRQYGDKLNLCVEILSVCDEIQMERVFRTHRPEYVFHAAAHKHVPLMEDAPEEAIQNNVFGTLNTAQLADKYNTRRFVLISTDKAVNPTTVMGATKRCCELVIQTLNRNSETEYVAVRFGNVLGSNGSVIPLFKKQIAEGGPVTVTHPDIIRYFMTIPEAVRLVLTASGMAKGGEIFILDMGKPVRILDMAKNMIRLSGLEPDKDIPIVFTGLRPGEKLFEELLLSEEGTDKTEHQKIYVAAPLNIEANEFWDEMQRMNLAVHWGNRQAALRELHLLVPTYHKAESAPSPEAEEQEKILAET
jgi:FlaA1/EpsC-like NDP-sugar epimerase